ncbi:MAG: helix-turn-helix domain-containing protein [Chitinophagales bacterium]
MQYKGINQEYFEVNRVTSNNCYVLKEVKKSELSLLWFDSDDNRIIIDSIPYKFNQNDIVCLTEFHQVEIVKVHEVKLLKFNRPFYCVLDHDSEIGCKGVLYYGAANLPIVQPNAADLDILETVWKMLNIEMVSKDNLQLEMLQMMLKRILILCTRIYKKQLNYNVLERGKTDTIREFNFLVENHFKEKHRVADYAKLLNKTPKSLSNLFKKVGTKTPLQFIQERIVLEARRLLKHSNKTISDIGYELGFIDVQSFSRFFNNREGIYPKDFRKLDQKEIMST